VAKEKEVIGGENLAHAIAEEFGDSGETFEFIELVGKRIVIMTKIDHFPSLGLMSTTTSSIFDHDLSINYNLPKEK